MNETWHVFGRGAKRLGIFCAAEEYLKYFEFLSYALIKSACDILAYCLMPNHYHLVLQGDPGSLSDCMQRVNYLYSCHHNSIHGGSGTSYERSYRAKLQRSDLILTRTVAYVLLNPVTDGLAATPADWPWSSYGPYCEKPFASRLTVEASEVLQVLDSDPARSRKVFAEVLQRQAAMPARPPSEKPYMDVMQLHFLWFLETAKLRCANTNEDPVLLAMYWARECDVPPRAMALALDQDPAWIRRHLLRFQKRVESEPELRRFAALP